MKPAVFARSSGSILPSAAAISAHIAMLALANSLVLNLPTCVLTLLDMSVMRDLSVSHRAIEFLPPAVGSQPARTRGDGVGGLTGGDRGVGEQAEQLGARRGA